MSDSEDYVTPDPSVLAALSKLMPFTVEVEEPEISQESQSQAEVEEEAEFEFRLFSKNDKVTLKDEQKAVFERQERPLDYYLAKVTEEARAQFILAAIEGEEVLKLSKQLWPSCAGKLRVSVIPFEKADKPNKRWRPSKKRRERAKAQKLRDAKETQRVASRLGQRRAALKNQSARFVSATRGRGRGR